MHTEGMNILYIEHISKGGKTNILNHIFVLWLMQNTNTLIHFVQIEKLWKQYQITLDDDYPAIKKKILKLWEKKQLKN